MTEALKAAKNSPKTTMGGILAFAVVLAPALQAQFDADPLTVAAWGPVVSALMVAIALFTARDNDVSSEEAKA